MPTQPLFPTIPEPSEDPAALFRTVIALKRTVEMLTGGDTRSMDGASTDRFAPHVFIQRAVPEALHPGDMWLCTGESYTMNIWDGGRWLLVNTLPTPAAHYAIDGLSKVLKPFSERKR